MLSIEQARAMRQGVTLSGDRNQCSDCGALFNSVYAFDKHRTGTIGVKEGPAARRCMSIVEMRFLGMVKNPAGFWVTAVMPQSAKEAYRSEIDAEPSGASEIAAAHTSPVQG